MADSLNLTVETRAARIAARRKYLSGGPAAPIVPDRLTVAEADLAAAEEALKKAPASRLAHLKVQFAFATYRDLLHASAGPVAVRLFLEQKGLRAEYDVGMASRALT